MDHSHSTTVPTPLHNPARFREGTAYKVTSKTPTRVQLPAMSKSPPPPRHYEQIPRFPVSRPPFICCG
ncbi:hypothetical protein E2C01_057275 [Portunus trituberculatus]|uniref:Uncharacterized protein n=1 Tax=Portunus trituberculatus TaxID=210409 RepID=A0A5B7GSI3_PORTR|nr:hypothetical protein [Portunus trituberculatus]